MSYMRASFLMRKTRYVKTYVKWTELFGNREKATILNRGKSPYTKGVIVVDIVDKALRMGEGRQIKKLENVAKATNALEDEIAALDDEELKGQTAKFKQRIENGESLDKLMPEAFATVREASKRTLGLRHFDVQLMGGAALHWGNIAEMKTGEGKTLVATLPAYLNALDGQGVHVVTVNDYLASYQAELMGRVYRFLGMSTGCIITNQKPPERRKQYNADITYGTNNEFGFDYLRDNMAWEKSDLVQRGHHYAIVDEVDSILIDEARTPLIISGPAEGDVTRWYRQFARLVLKLNRDEDYEVDEKKKVVGILDPGITKVEDYLGIDNLYEPNNTALIGYLNNAIKAKELFLRDRDYVVTGGEVLIVDEHTGRILPGRRYNEGLHQAIEAKEGVEVKAENQTFATITLQNYFRMYDKLAGMTGTAETEAAEFMGTYKLGVLPIPTNKPMIREDKDDLIFRTKKEKLAAIVRDVAKRHKKGQPVLLGTASVESSEVVSSLLDVAKIPHQVLNAKQHDKEAAVVAVAGRKGAVTVATNMAGRGTDIMLGGNAETMALDEIKKYLRHKVEDRVQKGEMDERVAHDYIDHMIYEANGHADTDDQEVLAIRAKFEELYSKFKTETDAAAEKVRAAGGLYILGTERHESRRIDNQLRGRAGRQGDPGESSFYISLEDDLMRLFGSERIQNMMDTLGIADDEPIDQKILSGAIENAQKKIESRNFGVRKHVLEYDDVLNTQRQTIYAQRLQVLEGKDVKDNIVKMIDDTIAHAVHAAIGEHSLISTEMVEQARRPFIGVFLRPEDCTFTPEECDDLTADQLTNILSDQAHKVYEAKEQALGSPIMRELERVVLLKNVDSKWMDHIDAMTELRNGIGLRAYGQYDPVVEYKREGFDMFDAMIDSIREDTVRMIFLAQVRTREEPKREQVAKETGAAGAADGSVKAEPKRAGKKPGPNDPCPCGSGKKYKKCCYLKPDDPYK